MSTEDKILALVEDLVDQHVETRDRLVEMEQKTAELGHCGSIATNNAGGLGRAVTENEQFKAFAEGSGNSARFEVKTAIVNATWQNQPFVPSDRSTSPLAELGADFTCAICLWRAVHLQTWSSSHKRMCLPTMQVYRSPTHPRSLRMWSSRNRL